MGTGRWKTITEFVFLLSVCLSKEIAPENIFLTDFRYASYFLKVHIFAP